MKKPTVAILLLTLFTLGSYLDPGYDIRIDSETRYDAPSPKVGFGVIAVRKK